MNKTIKKIVAFGIGAAMLGATVGGAAALSLADYPAPFVTNGNFVGNIVLGEMTGTVDTIGALDITASLQRASSIVASTTGTTATAMAEDGYHFSESTELILGANLNSVNPALDDTDLPELLVSGTVEGDDGSEYDYDVEIQFPSDSTVVVAADVNNNNLDDDYTEPIVYLDFGAGGLDYFYKVVIDFDDAWSLNDPDVSGDDSGINEGSSTIELFGRAYTFDPNDNSKDEYLTLFGSDTTLVVGKGETETITYNGKEYTVEVLGGNSDRSTAILRIGADTRTISEGDSRTIGGLPIYVKDVFVSNIGGDDISVQLFLGSNKLELEYATSGGEVKLNGNTLDEVQVAVESTGPDNWQGVDKLTFTVTPSENDVDYILPGEAYTDPLFGAFKVSFVGAEDLMEGKEALKFEQSGKKLNVVFTPRGASKATTLTLLDNNDFYDDFFSGATLANLQKDSMFLYTEDDGDADKAVTHLLQVTRIKDGDDLENSTSYEVSVKDLSFDKTYTVTKCKVLDTKIALYPQQTLDEDNVTFTTNGAGDCLTGGLIANNNATIYTNAGAEVRFYNTTTTRTNSSADIETGTGYFWIDEDAQDDADTSEKTSLMVKYAWDSADDAYSFTANTTLLTATDIGNDDNKEFALSDFGTYVVADVDSAPFGYVKMYIPAEEVTYYMFLLPVGSNVIVTSASSTGAVNLIPMKLGIAMSDTEALASLGSKPFIVVGGPCANTVAAALMGNPVDCAAGFSEGKGMIKLFTDQNALLVAGYSAKDTQGASRVLAYYKDYQSKFKGTELEIVTTNLASLSVNSVN